MSHSGAPSAYPLASFLQAQNRIFVTHTSLPCPEDPTSSLLVAVELSFDELADVVSVGAIEAANGTGVLAVAATNVGRGCAVVVVCAVVSSSDTSTVEPEIQSVCFLSWTCFPSRTT
jgi:hypothetical protein